MPMNPRTVNRVREVVLDIMSDGRKRQMKDIVEEYHVHQKTQRYVLMNSNRMADIVKIYIPEIHSGKEMHKDHHGIEHPSRTKMYWLEASNNDEEGRFAQPSP